MSSSGLGVGSMRLNSLRYRSPPGGKALVRMPRTLPCLVESVPVVSTSAISRSRVSLSFMPSTMTPLRAPVTRASTPPGACFSAVSAASRSMSASVNRQLSLSPST